MNRPPYSSFSETMAAPRGEGIARIDVGDRAADLSLSLFDSRYEASDIDS